jgi:uncharacterized protein YndB with AHSA1/START domain
MNGTATKAATQDTVQDIVIDEVLPHAPELIWKAITNGDLIGRWLMKPTGFLAVKGTRFTYQTTPGGAWDGVIHCEVLEVIPNERLVYAWKGGHESNVGYGSPLDTVVTFTLSKTGRGTRLRLVHAGFVLPRNEGALQKMGAGWKSIIPRIGDIAGEQN